MVDLTELWYEKREKRHILLFLDNCTVHNNAPPLSNVKLQFFPPNSTSKLQPLDQGIIHNFKTFYRREVVKSVLDNLENQQHVTTISTLIALIMNDKAWRAVTPLTIHCCFKKSGFPSPNLVDVDDTLTEFNAGPSLWEALPEQDLTFDDYVLVDTDIAVWGALSDAEIVALDHNNTESDEDESEELTPVTLSEAKVSLNKLRNFFLQNHVDADILQASFVLEKSIDKAGCISLIVSHKLMGNLCRVLGSSAVATKDLPCRADAHEICQALSPHVDLEWKFGYWDASSGVVLIT
ncbi:tigger transposable element-derived protein 6 [Trichonephila clavipes]|nr:tigger transposable element-derived protein 6 [Trichonephila clavipes]